MKPHKSSTVGTWGQMPLGVQDSCPRFTNTLREPCQNKHLIFFIQVISVQT